uniref:Ubiquitinyl hydrolase 1 n=1 Tax=Heterorhabditis bacteriophora TaxID=37862 RepID=A0A1I7XN07_HETBA
MRVNWARRLQYLLFLPSGRESKVDCDPSDTSAVEFPSIEILKEDDPFRKVQEKSEQEKSEMNAKVIAEWQKGRG